MKTNKYIGYFLLLALLIIGMPSASAQKEQKAKSILDKMSYAISNDNGIKATFLLKNYRMKKLSGETKGTILLKGEQFFLETPNSKTWFNGKTQWTYVAENEEINISTPTKEELQSINPYSFINLYKKGFTYRVSNTQLRQGKKVQVITLAPENKKQEISQIEIGVEPNSTQPTYIRVVSRNGEEMLVEVLSYQCKQNIPNKSFTLNPKQYPKAEIIDLR